MTQPTPAAGERGESVGQRIAREWLRSTPAGAHQRRGDADDLAARLDAALTTATARAEAAERERDVLRLERRNRASDCAEHSDDLARAVTRSNRLQRQLDAIRAVVEQLDRIAKAQNGALRFRMIVREATARVLAIVKGK